jgi:hypothetical protein
MLYHGLPRAIYHRCGCGGDEMNKRGKNTMREATT